MSSEHMEAMTAPARTVETVTLEIRTLQHQAQQMLLGYAIEIGRRLVEVKAMLPHGQWGGYIREQLGYSQSTANNMMRIFEEYGAAQQSLFGPEAKSQALGNLSYTKALRLLALPADEREEFAEANDVEAMSTRELEAAIRERDEARRQAEQDRADREAAERSAQKIAEDMALANQRLEQAAQREQELARELEELRSRPVDVAVQHAEERDLEQARREASAEAQARAKQLERELEAARKEQADLLARQKELMDQVKDARRERRDAMDAQKVAREELNAARDDRERLKKELKAAASKEITRFRVYLEACMEDFSKMLKMLDELKKAGNDEDKGKLTNAAGVMLDAMGKQLEPYREGGAPC